jgi:hypothetical protein
VRPGPLRSPETDICEKHGRGLEVARSPVGEHVHLVQVDLDHRPASPQQVVAQFRKEFGNVDSDPHLERVLHDLRCGRGQRKGEKTRRAGIADCASE